MNITRSASCSIEPDSRRSERIGRLSWRCSTARESCDIARIGTSRPRASTFSRREVGGHAEPEPGLAHARAGGDDDQVPRLESGGEPVEVTKPRGRSGHLGARLVKSGDPFEAVLQQLFDVAELARDTGLRQVEDDLLCPVDEVGRLTRPLPAENRDLAARPNQT